MIGLRNALMCYIFSILYKLIHFSLPSNPAIHRIGNTSIILCPRCKEKKEFQPYFIFIGNFPKLFSELINLKYAFSIPFKITQKTIILETCSQFHECTVKHFTHTQIRDTAFELDSKESFVKNWSFLLNNNGNLNIQFNQFPQINSYSTW